ATAHWDQEPHPKFHRKRVEERSPADRTNRSVTPCAARRRRSAGQPSDERRAFRRTRAIGRNGACVGQTSGGIFMPHARKSPASKWHSCYGSVEPAKSCLRGSIVAGKNPRGADCES